jgi:sulfite reductase (NADPH) flavoprotein alpha-component
MRPVYVLFGTESGNAQGLADRTGEALREAGLTAKVVDMMDFDGAELAHVGLLLVVTSTYGNGDPPSNAEMLHAFLLKKCPPLPGLAFSVCGLGDTTYERFAQCGKDFDRRLGELGATRLTDRQDCDVDYEEPFEKWLARAVAAMKERAASAPDSSDAADDPPVPAPSQARATDPLGSRRNPAIATVLENVALTGAASSKEARHVVLGVAGLELEPGDSVGLWVENDPALVTAVLKAAGASATDLVKLGADELSLGEALSRRLEIQEPDARLVERLASGASPDERHAMLKENHVLDLLERHGGATLGASLAGLLRPMAPRVYSLASSPRVHPEEVHLLVDVIRYDLGSRPRMGVASRQLAQRAPAGASIPVFTHKTPSFRLASPDVDVVMIGPGTGVAPFRAFLQERAWQKATGRAWLFFGARNRATDFFYEAELERFRKEGVLTRLDTAFSRDQVDKIYVQHRMRESATELRAWIDGGATVYVCGDAKHMAPDVHATMIEILADGGDEDAARARLDAMGEARRYQRDVY